MTINRINPPRSSHSLRNRLATFVTCAAVSIGSASYAHANECSDYLENAESQDLAGSATSLFVGTVVDLASDYLDSTPLGIAGGMVSDLAFPILGLDPSSDSGACLAELDNRVSGLESDVTAIQGEVAQLISTVEWLTKANNLKIADNHRRTQLNQKRIALSTLLRIYEESIARQRSVAAVFEAAKRSGNAVLVKSENESGASLLPRLRTKLSGLDDFARSIESGCARISGQPLSADVQSWCSVLNVNYDLGVQTRIREFRAKLLGEVAIFHTTMLGTIFAYTGDFQDYVEFVHTKQWYLASLGNGRSNLVNDCIEEATRDLTIAPAGRDQTIAYHFTETYLNGMTVTEFAGIGSVNAQLTVFRNELADGFCNGEGPNPLNDKDLAQPNPEVISQRISMLGAIDIEALPGSDYEYEINEKSVTMYGTPMITYDMGSNLRHPAAPEATITNYSDFTEFCEQQCNAFNSCEGLTLSNSYEKGITKFQCTLFYQNNPSQPVAIMPAGKCMPSSPSWFVPYGACRAEVRTKIR